MQDINRSGIYYYVLCIGAFASHRNLSQTEAFNYLYTYKGIDSQAGPYPRTAFRRGSFRARLLIFLIECYGAEHTLSLDDAVEDLATVCRNNGGTLA
jgi:hypothetical protein